ncbi:transcriptional regulator, TetR family [Devosia lucknowensis]|uniref:Transcriptional regulator, TetR family n=1 Tax=Devosia lucknowensis TaxID=1096929 RepID=A0A1Y6G5N0_9HYPH|nr:TetR/AcrR family transcriptional regulator [Devosia lucknowensis]SMQ85472.1 transcriptional regulator, TetR family [Devosia lucknowensis]
MTQKQLQQDYSSEAICERILQRHRGSVSVQKQHLAVANLSRIIQATLKLSNRQGFHAMSLRELASTAGLSMGGMYSYFDNKETLLLMILDAVSSSAQDVLSGAPEGVADDPVQHLNWLVETHIQLTEIMQPWFVFVFMEAKAFPEPAKRMAIASEAATEAMFADVLRRGVGTGAFAIDDVQLTAAIIKPLLQDWYVKRAKYRKAGISVSQYAGHVNGFVHAAIAAR